MEKPLRENVKIIVVDDEGINREFLQEILEESSGRDVHSFINGRKAWEYIRANDVDIIISDIDMPEMDGLTLLKKVREKKNKEETVVVMMSGNPDYLTDSATHGANHFMAKPFRIADVKRVITKYITGGS